MNKTFFEAIKSFGILKDEEIEDLFKAGKKMKLLAGDYFSKEGDVCKEVAFVTKGILRSFYYNSASEEITYCFRYENNFLSAYSSYLSGEASLESFQALTDVEYYTWNKTYIQALQENNIRWVRFLKKLTELEYLEMEKRIFILQKESAEKRYAEMLKNHPEYLQRIPLNYLASYLGITQRHLSRIRKNFDY